MTSSTAWRSMTPVDDRLSAFAHVRGGVESDERPFLQPGHVVLAAHVLAPRRCADAHPRGDLAHGDRVLVTASRPSTSRSVVATSRISSRRLIAVSGTWSLLRLAGGRLVHRREASRVRSSMLPITGTRTALSSSAWVSRVRPSARASRRNECVRQRDRARGSGRATRCGARASPSVIVGRKVIGRAPGGAIRDRRSAVQARFPCGKPSLKGLHGGARHPRGQLRSRYPPECTWQLP